MTARITGAVPALRYAAAGMTAGVEPPPRNGRLVNAQVREFAFGANFGKRPVAAFRLFEIDANVSLVANLLGLPVRRV